jgi:hypothetical protein
MEEKLQAIFEHTVAETDEDATELRRFKEEHLSTEKGLEIVRSYPTISTKFRSPQS